MKKKTAFAVFTMTDTGKDYLIKGNFGDDKKSADKWAENHVNDLDRETGTYNDPENKRYPNGLFVKEVEYL
jgi:hypothetical protein